MATHRKWLVKFHSLCVTPMPSIHDLPAACVTLSRLPGTVVD